MPTIPTWLLNKMNTECTLPEKARQHTLREKALRQAEGALEAVSHFDEYQEVLFNNDNYGSLSTRIMAKIMMAMDLAGWGGNEGFGRWNFEEWNEEIPPNAPVWSSNKERYAFWRNCLSFHNEASSRCDSWYQGALVAIAAIHTAIEITSIEKVIDRILASKKAMDRLNKDIAVKQVHIELDTATGEIKFLNEFPLNKIKEYRFHPTTHAAFLAKDFLKEGKQINWDEISAKTHNQFLLEMKDKEFDEPEEREIKFYIGEDMGRWFDEIEQVAVAILIWQRFEELCQEAVARKIKSMLYHVNDISEKEALSNIECYATTPEMILEVVLV